MAANARRQHLDEDAGGIGPRSRFRLPDQRLGGAPQLGGVSPDRRARVMKEFAPFGGDAGGEDGLVGAGFRRRD
jgi:hypothetical protein